MLVVVQWIDTVKECLKKRGLDIKQAREWSRIGINGGGDFCSNECSFSY